ncbi:hypothetical protein [Shinella sp.]|uniref:hypothetical protein n=1 Tax=Shinella sp. TaxID=1870904 RepID=UPI0028B20FDF|nr:hypothetical protein [Shinella sp.]
MVVSYRYGDVFRAADVKTPMLRGLFHHRSKKCGAGVFIFSLRRQPAFPIET